MAEDFTNQEQNSRKVEENTRKTAENVGRFSDALSKSSKDLQEMQNMFTDFSSELSRAAAGSGDLSSAFKNSSRTVSDLAKEAGTLAAFTEEGLKDAKSTANALKRQAVVKGKIKQLDSQIALLQDRIVNGTEEEAENINKTLETLYLARGESERLLDKFEDLSKVNSQINKETSWIDGISELVNEIPIIRRVLDDFTKAAKEARSASVDGFGAFGAGLGAAITSIGKIGLGIGFKSILSSIGRAQKRIKSLTADLNITRGQALAVQSSFVKIAQSIPGMTADMLAQSATEFSKALGASVNPTAAIVKTFTTLTQKLGLSVEQATQLAKISTATGMSFEQFSTTITGYTKLQNSANGVAIRFQDILSDISGSGAATLITTSKFEGGIQRAAYQARRLGLNFKTLEGTSSSLLDFQSSIGNEINAELLTGRRLDGNRLRMLALTGDQAELAKEIARQAGTEEEFREMNVIQQEALAKYLGMSRDQLAEMFLEQKALTKFSADEGKTLSEKVKSRQAEIKRLKESGQLDKARRLENQLIADLGETQLSTQIQNQTIQERMEESITKMGDAFTELKTPLGNINTGIEKLNEMLMTILKFPETFGTGLMKIFSKLKVLVKSLASGIMSPFTLLFKGVSLGFNTIVSGFKGVVSLIKGLNFSEIGPNLSKAFEGGLKTLKEFKFSEIGNKLSSAFKGVMPSLDTLKKLPSSLKNGFEKFGKFLQTGFIKIVGKGGLKALLKKIPLLGTLIGLGMSYKRFKDGDYTGAGMEFLSSILTLVPGAGTIASLGVDAALIATDVKGITGSKSLDKDNTKNTSEEVKTNKLAEKALGVSSSLGKSFGTLLYGDSTNEEDTIKPAPAGPYVPSNKPTASSVNQGTPNSSLNTGTPVVHIETKDSSTTLGNKISEDTNKLLARLIEVVEAGGDVFLDSRKVGEALVLGNRSQ